MRRRISICFPQDDVVKIGPTSTPRVPSLRRSLPSLSLSFPPWKIFLDVCVYGCIYMEVHVRGRKHYGDIGSVGIVCVRGLLFC